VTGLAYWHLKTRWMRSTEPVILDGSPRRPELPQVPIPPKFDRRPGVGDH
jgi:hypothetical protein